LSRPIQETDPTWPVSPYGIGKLTIENYLHYFNKKYNQAYTTFRMANPYGERQPSLNKQGVIPIFIHKIINGQEISVMGNGSMIRDYIYIKDVADVIVKSLNKKLKHSVYNLGTGTGYSINNIIKAIEKVTGLKAKINHISTPPTFIHTSTLDVSRLRKEFPEFVSTDLETGIQKTYNYLRKDNNER
jgi:UDP-glucose 4-epimerase